MAGHSKWHNIKIKKEKTDKARAKVFGKYSREIIVAAREGGGNPDANFRLRSAIDRAKEQGMPADNIQRAIARGAGGGAGENFEEILYEAYAPGGVALLIRAATDNRNRTAADVRSVFNKQGGNLAESGAVSWMFERKGVLEVPKAKIDEDELMLAALEAGAEDVRAEGDVYQVTTAPSDLDKVRQALVAGGIVPTAAELTWLPKNTVEVGGRDAERVLKLMEALDDLDDVQQLYANFDIPEEILQQVG